MLFTFVVIAFVLLLMNKSIPLKEQFLLESIYFGELNNGFVKVILFVSPIDCYSCSEFVLSKQFYNDLMSLAKEKEKKLKLYYVVYGGFTEETKKKYMSKSSKNSEIIFEQKYNVKSTLKKVFKTDKTPLMAILDHDNQIIHWQGFPPDEITVFRELRINLLRKLGGIL